ncbi:hypothetical protein EC9_22520 [Rosistilla ulvae]|uniref:Uncharacterized protein n=1 Tax=Rosistilla ulvae TaxID=1930277 RepID=A0A517LZM0_9BACT|nr:hypothetical protein [Rosistilla ulvae]QDS88066.1 hypothetical protein EC9_22520 [Rosistilla ulvae]
MIREETQATVVMIEASRCFAATDLAPDNVLTLIALVSDDPSDWKEAASLWSRYSTSVVCKSIEELSIREIGYGDALKTLANSEAWVVIDFPSKRVFSGGEFMPVTRDADFAMVADEAGNQHCPLSIHLPPWWEMHEPASLDAIDRPRDTPINKPHVDREVLYGAPFLQDIASRVLDTVANDVWLQTNAGENASDRYQSTVAIHRDWLMTPRSDLGGRMPRELLHGARQWIEQVTWGQQQRVQDGGPTIALPDDWADYATAPMGGEEMCLYFDLCREVIGAGWRWCSGEAGNRTSQYEADAATELTNFLRVAKNDWLSSPFEEGPSPSFIIQCSRRRVPRGLGSTIEGIEAPQVEEHSIGCDCPICEMLADGMFGIGFECLDGHHLELDNEFAFSMLETREAWEEQQREFGLYNSELDFELLAPEEAGQGDATLASAWSGICDDTPLPGDPTGHMKLAFMVAEIVSNLQFSGAPHDDVLRLNEAFANFRRSDIDRREATSSALKSNLQTLAERYPELISKSADLQSRIDELLRSSSPHSN